MLCVQVEIASLVGTVVQWMLQESVPARKEAHEFVTSACFLMALLCLKERAARQAVFPLEELGIVCARSEYRHLEGSLGPFGSRCHL